MGISAKRYFDVWSAICGKRGKRQRVESHDASWSTKPAAVNSLISELEQDMATINRRLAYVPHATIFSLDDGAPFATRRKAYRHLGATHSALPRSTNKRRCFPDGGRKFRRRSRLQLPAIHRTLSETLGATDIGTYKISFDFPPFLATEP